MIVVGLFLGVGVVGLMGWSLVHARRTRAIGRSVTEQWLNDFNYPKGGDRRHVE